MKASTLRKHAPLLVASINSILVLLTLMDFGISWDEPAYLHTVLSDLSWLKAPELTTIDTYWSLADGHPPFFKLLAGAFIYLFHETLGVADIYAAYRLTLIPFVFLSSWFITSFLVRYTSIIIAVTFGITFLVIPRVFFDAHMGALDFPVASLAVSAVIASVYGTASWRWFLVAVLLTALTFATKLQGMYFHTGITAFFAIRFLRAFAQRKKYQSADLIGYANRFLAMASIPFIIFYLLWPYLWPDPNSRIDQYIRFITQHNPILTNYLGQGYTNRPGDMPPWHYPWVLTAVTTPVPFLLAILAGAAYAIRHALMRWMLFFALFPLVISSLPIAQKYDGVRLFLPAFPFLTIIAAYGTHTFTRSLKRRATVFKTLIPVGILTLTALSSSAAHPFQMSYYNIPTHAWTNPMEYFESDYWGTSYLRLIPYLNMHPEDTYCVFGPDLFTEYTRIGQLDQRIIVTDLMDAVDKGVHCDKLIILNRMGYLQEYTSVARYIKEDTPLFSVMLGDQLLSAVYENKGGF